MEQFHEVVAELHEPHTDGGPANGYEPPARAAYNEYTPPTTGEAQ